MLRIRLKLVGKKSQPYYLIVLMNSKTKRNGKVIQHLGTYNPLNGKNYINFSDTIKRVKTGVQFSLTIKKILLGILLKKEIKRI